MAWAVWVASSATFVSSCATSVPTWASMVASSTAWVSVLDRLCGSQGVEPGGYGCIGYFSGELCAVVPDGTTTDADLGFIDEHHCSGGVIFIDDGSPEAGAFHQHAQVIECGIVGHDPDGRLFDREIDPGGI